MILKIKIAQVLLPFFIYKGFRLQNLNLAKAEKRIFCVLYFDIWIDGIILKSNAEVFVI